MAKINFRCDMSMIKNPKEKMYSVRPETVGEYPNGMIGYLGEFESGSVEIRVLKTPTAELIKTAIPVITHNPEVNYSQYTKKEQALGLFRNPSGKALRAREFGTAIDGVTLSEDFLDLTGKSSGKTTEAEVGDMFAIQANFVAGTQLKYSATVPDVASNKVYFKVINVENSHIPVTLGGDGKMFPSVYKLVDLAIVIQ